MRTNSILLAVLPLTLTIGLFGGCGSSDDDGSSGTGGTGAAAGGAAGGSSGTGGGSSGAAGTGGGSGTGGGGGAAGSGGGSAGTGNAGGMGGWPDPDAGPDASEQDAAPDAVPDVDFGYDAPVQEAGDACATATAQAEPVPLDIYIMLDRSGSMGTDCNFGSTTSSKWCRAVNSIGGFVQNPATAGNQVAIQYFPKSGAACDGSGYNQPAVDLGVLTGPGGFAQTIIDSLNQETPTGSNTPTEGGLRGLVQFTAAREAPPRVMIGILITDGQPNGCNQSATYMRDILGAHYASTGIHTFVVGMDGATFNTLETISNYTGAISHTNYCGTGSPCHHYDVGSGDPAVFISALQQIQQSAVGCTFQMPTTSVGVIDPEQVTVEYSPGGNPPPQELVRVPDAASCVPNGWYYDDNVNPSTINLCPDTCTMVQADPNAKVEVLLGCLGA